MIQFRLRLNQNHNNQLPKVEKTFYGEIGCLCEQLKTFSHKHLQLSF